MVSDYGMGTSSMCSDDDGDEVCSFGEYIARTDISINQQDPVVSVLSAAHRNSLVISTLITLRPFTSTQYTAKPIALGLMERGRESQDPSITYETGRGL